MHHDSTRAVLRMARAAAGSAESPLVIAVSGGLDSMVLMHAMAAVARSRIAAVATFDHGTGPAASRATAHVSRAARALRLPVVVGRSAGTEPGADGREATWRRERYRFLESVSAPLAARIVTAHTEDDQLETVLMRVMRGAGARGLTGLYAPSVVVRPFVGLRRASLARFARDTGVRWRDDPSNQSREFFRNRIRHDLLPALRRANPAIDVELLDVARRAAAWRAELEEFVERRVKPRRMTADTLVVASRELSAYGRDSLAVLWGSLAGRVGLRLDRRGTHRLAAFTMTSPRSGSVPLSGGWCMEARPRVYILRKRPSQGSVPVELPALGDLIWGGFRFRVGPLAEGLETSGGGTGSWTATLPTTTRATVRAWIDGDRLAVAGGQRARRVKRYLSDAGLRGLDRAGWPVVITEEGQDVIWIPGVRRADAATERSGRPVRHYVCERIDR